jgi:hypothetical protein
VTVFGVTVTPSGDRSVTAELCSGDRLKRFIATSLESPIQVSGIQLFTSPISPDVDATLPSKADACLALDHNFKVKRWRNPDHTIGVARHWVTDGTNNHRFGADRLAGLGSAGQEAEYGRHRRRLSTKFLVALC